MTDSVKPQLGRYEQAWREKEAVKYPVRGVIVATDVMCYGWPLHVIQSWVQLRLQGQLTSLGCEVSQRRKCGFCEKMEDSDLLHILSESKGAQKAIDSILRNTTWADVDVWNRSQLFLSPETYDDVRLSLKIAHELKRALGQ